MEIEQPQQGGGELLGRAQLVPSAGGVRGTPRDPLIAYGSVCRRQAAAHPRQVHLQTPSEVWVLRIDLCRDHEGPQVLERVHAMPHELRTRIQQSTQLDVGLGYLRLAVGVVEPGGVPTQSLQPSAAQDEMRVATQRRALGQAGAVSCHVHVDVVEVPVDGVVRVRAAEPVLTPALDRPFARSRSGRGRSPCGCPAFRRWPPTSSRAADPLSRCPHPDTGGRRSRSPAPARVLPAGLRPGSGLLGSEPAGGNLTELVAHLTEESAGPGRQPERAVPWECPSRWLR